jgi:hypothetical protein
MKLLRFILPMILLCAVTVSKAQTAKPAFTDEDLKKYAITMDSVKGMKETLKSILTEMVQKNTVMKVTRYNELFKIIDNPEKLAEAKATPEEIAFVKEVDAKRVDETARINAAYQGLAKDYVGLKAFNAIKKSLETDQALKERYESISKELPAKGGK